MKTTEIKTLLIIAFLTIFATACTDLYSDEDNLIEDPIEKVRATDNNQSLPPCKGKDC